MSRKIERRSRGRTRSAQCRSSHRTPADNSFAARNTARTSSHVLPRERPEEAPHLSVFVHGEHVASRVRYVFVKLASFNQPFLREPEHQPGHDEEVHRCTEHGAEQEVNGAHVERRRPPGAARQKERDDWHQHARPLTVWFRPRLRLDIHSVHARLPPIPVGRGVPWAFLE